MNKEELVNWIRYLYKNNEIYKFYKSRHFRHLKDEVLKEQKYECQRCKEKGKLTIVKPVSLYKGTDIKRKRSGVVHHVNEVKDRPDLALSKYYYDDKGNKKRNLIVLCDSCHEIVHKRFEKKEPLNIERW